MFNPYAADHSRLRAQRSTIPPTNEMYMHLCVLVPLAYLCSTSLIIHYFENGSFHLFYHVYYTHLRPPWGSVKLSFTNLISLVPLKQFHHNSYLCERSSLPSKNFPRISMDMLQLEQWCYQEGWLKRGDELQNPSIVALKQLLQMGSLLLCPNLRYVLTDTAGVLEKQVQSNSRSL